MFKEIYNKTIKLAGHKSSKLILGIISFIESFIFPIPPDVLIIPMTIAKKISENLLNKNACNNTKFFAFYQPISNKKSEKFVKHIITETRSFFKNQNILIDLSDIIDENDFTDLVHINQSAKKVVGEEIFKIIYPFIKDEC